MKFLVQTLALLVVGLSANFAAADTYEPNWDRPGFDYHSFEMSSSRVILCQWNCQKDKRCKAWTYVKAGVQGPKPRCWLKNWVPNPVQNNCCTSGIIQ